MQSDESLMMIEEGLICSPWEQGDESSKGFINTDECCFKKCCKKYKKKGKKHCMSCLKR